MDLQVVWDAAQAEEVVIDRTSGSGVTVSFGSCPPTPDVHGELAMMLWRMVAPEQVRSRRRVPLDRERLTELAIHQTRYTVSIYTGDGEADRDGSVSADEETAFQEQVTVEQVREIASLQPAEVAFVSFVIASFAASAVAEVAMLRDLHPLEAADAVMAAVADRYFDENGH